MRNGVDHGGSINVLTSHDGLRLAFGSAQHTIMVEVERLTAKRLRDIQGILLDPSPTDTRRSSE